MSEAAKTGSITWTDLTVENAEEVRDFYAAVVGWKPEGVPMGDYEDYSMNDPDSGRATAGVCHARGGNTGLPAQWLLYITVDDLDASLKACAEHGGEAVTEVRSLGGSGRFCVIRDPGGAVAALYEPAK
ncbi:VOC family protein [bacterium]|nr:VOC family protein [bacterium]